MSNLRPLSELYQYKKSDICIFLGSGPSINKISDKEWKKITKCDSWTVNNWVYHPFFVPDFYNVETKWYGYDILKRRFEEKHGLYKGTKFLFPSKRKVVKNKLSDVVGNMPFKFNYLLKYRDRKRTHPIFNADYQFDTIKLTKSYDMSITAVLELIYKMGYQKIFLYGVDLYNSYYFWTNKNYGEVHHQTNKEHENKNPNLPHSTEQYRERKGLISSFIIDFNRRWLLPEGKEMFVGHKKTLLYPRLKYRNILEGNIS
ncbi:MAG: hypothetical protein ACTSUP_09735 [Candidatus Heimdallarchaeaceae archaeon]